MSGNIALLAPDDTHLEAFNRFAPDGAEITWVDSTQLMEEQARRLKDFVVIIATPVEFPVELARACPNLKLVQTTSAGLDRIDIQALGELGVRVANNGGGNSASVAEHAIALMVSVNRKFQLQFQSAREKKWEGEIRKVWFAHSHELTGKTVGIFGLGQIGRQVARRLQGWECDLVYSDVAHYPPELEGELHVRRVSKEELLRTSDIVTLHVPLNRHTRGMMSDAEFDMMKPTAILINTCRGPVVDEAALIRALKEGKIAAAGLDVLEVEPTPPDNPLLEMDNVLITPHMGGMAQEAYEKNRAFAAQNAARVAGGEEPQSVVLPE